MKKTFTILSLTALSMASTASAQLQITQVNTPTVITFDADTPGIYQVRTGTGNTRAILEPTAYDITRRDGNKASAFLSLGVASRSSSLPGYTGQGKNSPTRFANDGNGNGQTNDEIGFNRVYRPDQPEGAGLTSNAVRLSSNNDFAQNALYFRIQNNTGETVHNWTFTADLFMEEPDTNLFSNIQFSYAVSNGDDPAAMTFTPFGNSPTITQGMTLSGTPQFQLNATVTASVAQGDYIILAISDINRPHGSTVFVDNIGITAVAEPSSYALIGLGLNAQRVPTPPPQEITQVSYDSP